MYRNAFFLIFTFVFAIAAMNAMAGDKSKNAVEANVWTTADGAKHFVCPVMGGEDVVTKDTPYSVVDGKKYYHCCGGCSEKLTANPEKFLKNFAIPGNVVKVDDDGQHFQCPVSGEMGLVESDTKFADADGKRYYFCCNSCKKKFEKEPAKFTAAMKKVEHKHDHGSNHDHQHHNH